MSDEEPNPAENGVDGNATFKTVPDAPANNPAAAAANNNGAGNNNASANNGNRLPSECYPKDVLTPKDLLPQDAHLGTNCSAGQGSLGDQNF